MNSLLLLISFILPFASFSSEVIYNRSIDIEAFHQKELSTAQKIAKKRALLEKKNLELMKSKIEEVRLMQELSLRKKIEKAMTQTLNNI